MSRLESDLKRRAIEAKRLKVEAERLRLEGNAVESLRVEKEYLKLRLSVVEEVTRDVSAKAAVPLSAVRKRVESVKRPPRRETGIRALDRNLVTDDEFIRGSIGGISAGNFIQIAGSRGAGKTSMLLKIVGEISVHEPVVWFDFEMGERRFTEKISAFRRDEEKFQYYAADRKLEAIIEEIKLQYASGVRTFVIDSAMKINTTGDRYEQFSKISRALSELTSSLEITIWLVNQMSQSAERDGILAIKHGNDAEYDADLIFFLLRPTRQENGKPAKDEFGQPVPDDSRRVLYCTKNRQDDRTFSVEIPKSAIFGIKATEIEYSDEEIPA